MSFISADVITPAAVAVLSLTLAAAACRYFFLCCR